MTTDATSRSPGSLRRFLRETSLASVFLLLFLATLVGQAFAGWQQFNAEQFADGLGRLTFWHYVTTATFAGDVTENWQSEYLQFLLYIVGTIWMLQKGSPESKSLDQGGLETDEEQKVGRYAVADSPRWAKVGGARTALFSWSLSLVMGSMFLASWGAQSLGGWAQFNETRLERLQAPISWGQYVTNADFWARSLQNWQSEMLAVGSMVVLSIYLRQRGSPESKPVGQPHTSTGIES
jgi:hypothetical protein